MKKALPFLLASMFLVGLVLIAGAAVYWNRFFKEPLQPIQFSHKIHLSKVGLNCDHCHRYPDQGPRAGIPSVQVCIKCHESAATDREEVQKLLAYWSRQETIPWLKVHRNPWHVRFAHRPHIQRGFECRYCHGAVEEMSTVHQVRSLEMGWCLTCHRQKDGPDDCLACHR